MFGLLIKESVRFFPVLAAAIPFLWVVGLADEAQTSLYDADLTGPLVLVLGAEAGGLRRLTKARCQQLARIPMAGSVESLNVSVAAGIALFEAVRRLAA